MIDFKVVETGNVWLIEIQLINDYHINFVIKSAVWWCKKDAKITKMQKRRKINKDVKKTQKLQKCKKDAKKLGDAQNY